MGNKNSTIIIKPKSGWLELNLKEVWKYKDLIFLFVKRNFTTMYKQTILGPLWIIINPLLTTIMFTVVFGNIAKIPTEGVPQFLFYMTGNTAWIYFSYCLTSTSTTFTSNAAIFGKVYFPRLVTPISTVITGLLNFGIQIATLCCFIFYFMISGSSVHPNSALLLLPLLIIQMAMLGLGFGIIISSLTTKYRDLAVLVTFGVQLWMYATPVVYPMSMIPQKYKFIMELNPMASVVETFRYAFLGAGQLDIKSLLISALMTVVVLFIGIILFNRIEKTFMDTV